MRGASRWIWLLTFLCLAACAALKARLEPPTPVETGILIRYEDAAASRVEVAGQFNDWKIFPDQKALVMTKDDSGVWGVVIPYRQHSKVSGVHVEPGQRYQYKIVINGVSWIEDPNNTLKSSEGGFTNSLIIVPERRTK